MIDARGLRCPWPAIRLARALREAEGDRVAIEADDPAAPRELAAVAGEQGWVLEAAGEFRFVASRAPAPADA